MIYYLIHVFAIDNLLTTHRMRSMVRQHSGMSSLPLYAASLNSGFYWQINCAHKPQGLKGWNVMIQTQLISSKSTIVTTFKSAVAHSFWDGECQVLHLIMSHLHDKSHVHQKATWRRLFYLSNTFSSSLLVLR